MPTSPPVTPPPKPPTFDAKVLIGDIAHGFETAIAHSPWLGIVFAVVVLSAVVRFVRDVIHSGHPKDAVRRFSQADRQVIFNRAGDRCEHHFPIVGRCRTTTGLEADHVHPHSRGGWTSISNGQALCQRHNREKSARVPWNRQLNNLAIRRATYFLPGHEPVVVRHRPPAAVATKTTASRKRRTSRQSPSLNDEATPTMRARDAPGLADAAVLCAANRHGRTHPGVIPK